VELLDAIRAAIGEDLNERSIAAALRNYNDTVWAIGEAFRSVPKTVLPERIPGELVVAQEMPDFSREVSPDGTLNLLLFAHRVVVSDPFPQLEMLLHPWIWADDSPLEQARHRLGIVLRWLAQIAPLVDEGIVTICAGDGFPQPPPPPEDESIPEWMDGEFLQMRLQAEYLNSFAHSPAEVRFWDQVLFSVVSGHRTDPIFDTEEAEQRFSALLQQVLDGIPDVTEAQRRLRVLLHTTQPDFSGLHIEDVTAVRESGVFAQWQETLSFAIEARTDAPADLADAAFDRELADSWQRLARGMTTGRRLAELRARTVDFTVNAVATGAVFAAGLASSHDLGFALETSGAAAVAMNAWPALQVTGAWLRGDVRRDRALRHHFQIYLRRNQPARS
jgi:hypothetical protein